MRLIHSTIPVGFFPPLTPPLKNNETLSLERRNPYSTGCCCRCIFPLFPSHVFAPLSPSFFLHSLFPYLSCYLYELTPLTLGSFRMEGSPGGGSGGRLRKVCVCECVRLCDCVRMCVKASVWPTGHPCTEGPLCTSLVYNTSTLLYSALLLRSSLSLQPVPILSTDTFMHRNTHINTHI